VAVGLHLITNDAIDAALREFVSLGREAFLRKHGFGTALQYLVQDPLTGTWADSKAIVGAAYGVRFPDRGPLRSTDFSGGEAQVVKLLRQLNFKVATPAEIASEAETSEVWARAEVELLVADYLDMLALELAGQTFNKSERRRALLPLLNGRTEAAIEFKRRNVSAGLLELGYPPLRGYLPAANKQALLLDVLEQQLGSQPSLDELAISFSDKPAVPVEGTSYDLVQVPIPSVRQKARIAADAGPRKRRAMKRDYLEREARNTTLGLAGELLILDYERRRLALSGLVQLADKVRHVSVEDGDGLGYDIHSFTESGANRFLEVKTTALGELTPYFVSASELEFAREQASAFHLCRVFDFRDAPRFFELKGTVESHCLLDPFSYRAHLLPR